MPVQAVERTANLLAAESCCIMQQARCCLDGMQKGVLLCSLCRGVNFENANFNVGLPVFTIHGNHDDPAGADNLSAVDVLSTCNLVNYFGKAVSNLTPLQAHL